MSPVCVRVSMYVCVCMRVCFFFNLCAFIFLFVRSGGRSGSLKERQTERLRHTRTHAHTLKEAQASCIESVYMSVCDVSFEKYGATSASCIGGIPGSHFWKTFNPFLFQHIQTTSCAKYA